MFAYVRIIQNLKVQKGRTQKHGSQGYLAHKQLRPLRTLQWDYAYGLTAVLGGGRFLMSEVTLYASPLSRGVWI